MIPAAAPVPTSRVVVAEGAILERILTTMHSAQPEGLGRAAFTTFNAAQARTSWGRRAQQPHALLGGDHVLASARTYELSGVLDGSPVRVCGIGSAFADPQGDESHVRELLRRLTDAAQRDGVDVVLLFVQTDLARVMPAGIEAISPIELELDVAQSARHGAPMTLVRGGEDRDLAAIVAMNRARAEPFRFSLDRDVDFVKHVITRKRLLAGLSGPGARELHFVIAEEGITAAAYVVISMVGHEWTLEECGDRDASGARVGALLQALIAREPGERRPRIRGWLPPGFLPPQVTVVGRQPAPEILMVRRFGEAQAQPPLSAEGLLYWRADFL